MGSEGKICWVSNVVVPVKIIIISMPTHDVSIACIHDGGRA